jgi:NAD(P)-dependent dehydrogenase (short-subunit alcohol dehydrogenase family)
VIGTIHLINLFIPLILKGDKKKVITLSTGFADTELTARYNLPVAGPYSISKAAVNMAVAKFSAQYAEDGVLFIAISPGSVETGQFNERECSISHTFGKRIKSDITI